MPHRLGQYLFWRITMYVPTGTSKVNRACARCGKDFVTKNSSQKFCTKECCNLDNIERRNKGRFIIFARDGFRCIYCGKSSIHNSAELHAEHVIPRSSGGEDIAGNIATACKDCNLEKSKKQLKGVLLEEIQAEIRRRNLENGIGNYDSVKLSKSCA